MKPSINVSFAEAKPTKTHMILKKLVDSNIVKYIISQNIDGLHLKSGLARKYLAELHGNMFIDECNLCKRQFVRSCPVETVGKKCSGVPCASGHAGGRPCRGRLYDGVLDWEHSLPESDLSMSELHSSLADLSICLGTTLQIIPSGNLPLETLKYGGKLVICNLQPTKHDNKADLVINYYVDDILEKIMTILGLEIPEYNDADNYIKLAEYNIIDWTVKRKDVLALEKVFKAKSKGVKKKRILVKNKRNSTEVGSSSDDDKSKVIKLENKEANNVAPSPTLLGKNTRTKIETTTNETTSGDDNAKVIKSENEEGNNDIAKVILGENKRTSTEITAFGIANNDDNDKMIKSENEELNNDNESVSLPGKNETDNAETLANGTVRDGKNSKVATSEIKNSENITSDCEDVIISE
ncbi:NAD-dependent protein deacetylase Sirt6 isoform X2 [Pararge aegeria]|nr:NAD-dependent protein deacetylase Sirt6 isoform X2 [Pararge aegeria]XP_039758708.1 NAD-dependent protein deacetylase Sirt6 isoform X2 [Pararge aegeria]